MHASRCCTVEKGGDKEAQSMAERGKYTMSARQSRAKLRAVYNAACLEVCKLWENGYVWVSDMAKRIIQVDTNGSRATRYDAGGKIEVPGEQNKSRAKAQFSIQICDTGSDGGTGGSLQWCMRPLPRREK